MALTRRQREIFDFISAFVEEQGYSPSLEEIAGHFGLSSVATVHKHVQHLVEKGLLRKAWNRSRSVEPVPQSEREGSAEDAGLTTLPLVGTVAAGAPIEAIENFETIDLEELFTGPNERFILEVQGDSMIDEQIRDGDLVVAEKRSRIRNGDTVIAVLPNGDATLKRFFREKDRIRVQPANRKYKPTYVRNVDIQGVVIGVIRRY